MVATCRTFGGTRYWYNYGASTKRDAVSMKRRIQDCGLNVRVIRDKDGFYLVYSTNSKKRLAKVLANLKR